MLKKMRQVLKSERGQITVVEIVILVAIIAVVASLFGGGLKEVFVGESGEGGAINSLKVFVDGKFDEAIPTP